MLELREIIALLGVLIANGIALATSFTRLNIRIAEVTRDQLALKAKFEDHVGDNKEDIREVKTIAANDRVENRADHADIVRELAVVNKNISDLRVDIVKTFIKKNDK